MMLSSIAALVGKPRPARAPGLCALSVVLAAGIAAGQTASAPQSRAQLHLESRSGPAEPATGNAAARQQSPKVPSPGQAASKPAAPATAAASPAQVTLNQGQLTVSANNSDLRSILTNVAASSGMTIEGLDKSARVFGQYGPGTPRDVLTALLDDTGYNFVMLGGANGSVPRQLVLTAQTSNSLPPPSHAQAASDDDNSDADDQEPLGPGAIPHPPPEPSDDPQVRAQQHLDNLQRMHDILEQRQQQQEQQREQQDNAPQ